MKTRHRSLSRVEGCACPPSVFQHPDGATPLAVPIASLETNRRFWTLAPRAKILVCDGGSSPWMAAAECRFDAFVAGANGITPEFGR